MLHRDRRHVHAGHGPDPVGPKTACINDDLTRDVAFLRMHHPLAAIGPGEVGHSVEPIDLGARLTGPPCESIRRTGWVAVPVELVMHRPDQAVHFHERKELLCLFRRDETRRDPQRAILGEHMPVLVHAVRRRRQTETPCGPPAGLLARFRFE